MIEYVFFGPYAQSKKMWLALSDNVVIGHIHLEEQVNNKIKFFDAWIDEDFRRRGIYRKLWETRWEYVQQHYSGWKVYAWCLPMSLPLLLEKGFEAGDTCVYVEKSID